ncbi:MAG: AI-2E family transporter [Clostridia bacterium]|nr:AI-2E family transporter [Clostridia bacterium]
MKISFKTCLKLGITIILVYLGIYYLPSVIGFIGSLVGAAAPLIIGAAIAYVINIILVRYEKMYFPKSNKKAVTVTRRPICLTLSVLSVIAVISIVVGLVLPQLISCIQLIITKIPGVITSFTAKLGEWNIITDEFAASIKSVDWGSKIGQMINVIGSGLGNVMDVVITTVSSVFSGVVTTVLSIIFAVYILASKEKLSSQFEKLIKHVLKGKWYTRTRYALETLNNAFRSYIIGQCTEAVILGSLCALGMLILGLPYAAMIGALIAFTALIPVAGAYIGAIVGALMIVTESPVKALIFLIFLLVLQQLEGNLIYPRVVGNSIGLPGIWVLAAVTVGGGIMGVVGMLLGVPIAAALYKMIKDVLDYREKQELKQNK